MARPKREREQHYIDVVERVLCGVQVTTGDEAGPRVTRFEGKARPVVGRLSRPSVSVTSDGREADVFEEFDPARDRE